MPRECPHCSAPLEDDDTVCPSCGRSVIPVSDEAPAPIIESPSEPQDDSLAVSEEEIPDAVPEATAEDVPDTASAGAPEPEIRFDSSEEPHFETEPSALDEGPVGEAAPAPGTRYVVFRCERCQMPMAPGTTTCLRCGLQRAEPVPHIPIHASPQSPFLRQGEYYCPECQAVLAPQSNLCTNCGAEFVSAVPPVSWGTPNTGAMGANAALWNRSATRSGPEPWKIIAAVIAVVAFAAVLLMIGALSTRENPTETTITSGPQGNVAPPVTPSAPALPPVVMAPGTGGADSQVHASPVGTWVKGRDSMRLDEIGGAWIDAPDITGTKSKVNMNWSLVDTPTGQVVHVQGPGYTWDFAWNFGADGSETLTQTQWGELKKLKPGQKPGGKPVPKP